MFKCAEGKCNHKSFPLADTKEFFITIERTTEQPSLFLFWEMQCEPSPPPPPPNQGTTVPTAEK